MDRHAEHDPDEERQQEYPRQDRDGQLRIGPDGELVPAEPDQPPAGSAPKRRGAWRRGKGRRRPIVWRPHDRGYDFD